MRPAILGLGLLVAMAGMSTWALRATSHVAYHRSQAAMNERWAELVAAFPACTSRGDVLEVFGLKEADLEAADEGTLLRVRVPLSIPPDDYRDYRGFEFAFSGDTLRAVRPIGPDGPGIDVPLPPSVGQSGRIRCSGLSPVQAEAAG